MAKSKIISISIGEKDQEWWDKFEETVPTSKRSEYILKIIKDYFEDPELSETEREFNQYCLMNSLSKDAQLGLLMGPYRVWCGDPDAE